jgi:putative hydrolase of the HAD superfamily
MPMAGASSIPTAPIRAVLFDADGVLQFPRMSLRGWTVAMGRLGGPGFWREVCEAERGTIRGEADLRPVVESILDRRGRRVGFDEVMRLWCDWTPDPRMLELVRRLRESGVRCVIASNQQRHRGEYMKATHGYQGLFDATFYSFELGEAKPDEAFFVRIGEALGLPPESMILVDDHQPNVGGARRAGLHGIFHEVSATPEVLAGRLRAFGLGV